MLQGKELFIDIVKKNIQRDGIENLLEYLANSDFYDAPASTRYHGAFKGGLLAHCLNVYEVLVDEIENFVGDQWMDIYDPESVAIVALFHDMCKINTYEIYQRNVKNEDTGKWEKVDAYRKNAKFPMGHGEKSVFMLMNYIALTPEEALAISWHMGGYDISVYKSLGECSQAWNKYELAFLLHIADLKATYLLENREDA